MVAEKVNKIEISFWKRHWAYKSCNEFV